MKIICHALLYAFLIHPALCQKSRPNRFIAFAESPVDRRIGLQDILFTAASKNALTLYRFDDFNKSPKTISFADLKKGLLIEYSEWESGTAYESYHHVRYNGKNYKCKSDSVVNKPPGQNPDHWTPLPPQYYGFFSLDLLGFDYSSDGIQKPGLQFIHFYLQDIYSLEPRYIASIRADEAVKTLNQTNILLFTHSPMNYFAGDIFFFNRDERDKILNDFINHVDTSQIDKRILNSQASYSPVNFLTKYKNGKVQKLMISVLPSGQPPEQLVDSVSVSEIRLAAGPQKKIVRLGDALLDTSNIRIYKKVGYKLLKDKPVKWTENFAVINRIASEVIERLTFRESFYASYYSPSTYRTLDEFMELIFHGIQEQKIAVYDNVKLDSLYTMEAITERWTYVPATSYPSWDSATVYYTDDVVNWNGRTYAAMKDNVKQQPDRSKEHWKITSSGLELYQPFDVGFMDITYSLLFDNSGNVITKKPHVIMIGIPGSKTSTGVNQHLGYMKYSDIESYVSANGKHVLPTIRELIEKQTGLFSIEEYGVLLASDQ